ncbi:MAG: beta-glycosidase, partial [Tannerella sp.]|nr:beta-glycosidase [Tannerella sp.]
QDYPGQGSAYIGILDAFMDTKGLISPDEWRGFCSEIVPLLSVKKFCYTNNEILTGDILIANYSKQAIENGFVEWKLEDEKGRNFDNGRLEINIPQGKLSNIGTITPKTDSITQATKVILTLKIKGAETQNTYPLWIYPDNRELSIPDNILVTAKLDTKAQETLKKGGKVLWFPDHKEYESITVGGLFQTDYWNYRMFKTISESIGKPVSPGTMGILTKPEHPLFSLFPTDFHTNWQWFIILKNSRPAILDKTPNDYTPIVQVIDNIERNHKLGLIMECSVESGKLIICMSNLPEIQQYPEAKQLYRSILSYMDSDKFAPTAAITFPELSDFLKPDNKSNNIGDLHNISY